MGKKKKMWSPHTTEYYSAKKRRKTGHMVQHEL